MRHIKRFIYFLNQQLYISYHARNEYPIETAYRKFATFREMIYKTIYA